MAKREAQARSVQPWEDQSPAASATTALAAAELALAERVKAFTEASEALRAEIAAFGAAVAEAEGRPAEPGLRLVVSRETAEVEAISEEKAEGEPPTPAQIAEFFRVHEHRDDSEPEPEAPTPPVASPARPRNPARDRLYADVGGTIIGLGGAVALIDFVLLR